MLFNITKNLIKKGRTDRLREKIGVLYLAKSFTEAEYNELISLLDEQEV